MFIQTESTPNPQTMKFLPGVPVMPSGTAFYTDAKLADESPLAAALFKISEVSAIFLGSDFITVTKKESAHWELLKTDILTTIMDFFVSGGQVMLSKQVSAGATSSENDSAIVREIKELIESRVRPAVAQDGGDIVFHSYEEGIVKLEMHGSCSGCPSSTATLKHGIENMLKHYIPEIVAVEPV
ncbi:MAG: NifU family protein [Rickettsiales bacterium]|nr:NifU family protein [Rickettsiales bacterium]